MEAKIAIEACAIAATVPLKELAPIFDGRAVFTRPAKTVLVVQYPDDGWTVVHDFGAAVFFGVPDEERTRVLDAMKRYDGEAAGTRRSLVRESFAVEVRPDATRANVRFDAVVVRELTQPVVELVAFVIGQSVAMEYYEDDVDRILGRLASIAAGLEAKGRFQGNVRELLRFVGRGMSLRNRVIHTLALLDSPALAWEDEVLDRMYRELRQSFAIEDRYRALDHKLQMIGQNLELVVDLTQTRRSMLLEILVVVLIFIETVLFVLQMKGH